jgi:hypothetical protein
LLGSKIPYIPGRKTNEGNGSEGQINAQEIGHAEQNIKTQNK